MVKFDFANGKSVRIANLTPHPISILVYDNVITVPVEYDYDKDEPVILRVAEKIKEIGYYNGVRLIKKELDDSNIRYEDVERLKKIEKDNDIIIVSLPCKDLIKKMLEVGAIDLNVASKFYVIGSTVRDNKGFVAYADSLSPIL